MAREPPAASASPAKGCDLRVPTIRSWALTRGFRAPSWDQESVRDSVHEDSASAPIAAGQRPRPSFRHPQAGSDAAMAEIVATRLRAANRSTGWSCRFRDRPTTAPAPGRSAAVGSGRLVDAAREWGSVAGQHRVDGVGEPAHRRHEPFPHVRPCVAVFDAHVVGVAGVYARGAFVV